MINSLFRRPFKFSVSFVSSSLFPGVPSSNYHGDPPKSLQGFTLCFQLLFPSIGSSFCYRSSSWRLYMVVRQGFFAFFNCSSRFSLEVMTHQAILKSKHGAQHMFCFEELKYSSSCILKCNSFYFIF